jgi:hypothetical protein
MRHGPRHSTLELLIDAAAWACALAAGAVRRLALARRVLIRRFRR